MRVVADAPAKLNLYLAVGSRLPDGYHHVDTVLVALDLCDTVIVEPAAALHLTCEPDVGAAAEENLAWRAAVALGEAVGKEPAVSISVSKRIRAGAGLGGGSADAAAVLAGLARLWDMRSDDPVLERTARSLGADVPFCLRGGCALYGGRGDRLIRGLPLPSAVFALVNPGPPVPTDAAYAAFDRLLAARRPGPASVTDALGRSEAEALGAALFNNMTEASAGLVPEVRNALALMRGASNCRGAEMAGSGSTVFGVFDDESAAVAAVERARERSWWATVARPRAGGALASTTTGVTS